MNDATKLIIPVACDPSSLPFQNMVGSANVVACAPIAVLVLPELDSLPDGILITLSVIRVTSSVIKDFLAHSAERHTGN